MLRLTPNAGHFGPRGLSNPPPTHPLTPSPPTSCLTVLIGSTVMARHGQPRTTPCFDRVQLGVRVDRLSNKPHVVPICAAGAAKGAALLVLERALRAARARWCLSARGVSPSTQRGLGASVPVVAGGLGLGGWPGQGPASSTPP